MKTVYTLFRVSTVKQVDVVKDDIPMQRIACHDFAERQGWMIAKEFEEKGVSGFKVSAEKRDAIQDLKDAAPKNEFDILLVFMFDRQGSHEYCFVSHRRIAADLKISVSTVKRALDELERKGDVDIEQQRRANGSRCSNVYRCKSP